MSSARKVLAEYIWLDGYQPQGLRSKTKLLEGFKGRLESLPEWSFDGSSTKQADGHDSDCFLKPICFRNDPIRGTPHILVLCEVLNESGEPHDSNTRSILSGSAEKHTDQEAIFGVEQEYTLFDRHTNRPLGWPMDGFPAPQGPYYCGVGADKVFGRALVEEHLRACLAADLDLCGINAEVMPAQWEFQIGPKGAIETADQLWLARWLLYRLGENRSIVASLHPKPIEGDWNGAGGHVNFSTKTMRESGGIDVIKEACEKLGKLHAEHISVYGENNDKRLTGKHETCSIKQFRYGVSDRGASIRIPIFTARDGFGYLEDRRPAANLDPYMVFTAILETVCGNGFDPNIFKDRPH
ncbi:MAG: glutamine synthetase beta-grasp domain-containing protein [bacterium]|nr:glutamine synthetase beta-grasp domain-containing protein [bacterium]